MKKSTSQEGQDTRQLRVPKLLKKCNTAYPILQICIHQYFYLPVLSVSSVKSNCFVLPFSDPTQDIAVRNSYTENLEESTPLPISCDWYV